MISDSGMEGEEQNTMGEEESQMQEMQGSMETPQEEVTTTETTEAPRKKSGGRRAALRIVRESVDRVGKDLANFRKSQEASQKRLERQLAQLRSDISALKSHVAKEATRAREKQESMYNKVIQKVGSKSSAAPKKSSSPKKKSKSKSKGKK